MGSAIKTARAIDLQGLVKDSRNANRGTKRGRQMLEASLRSLGAGRSILLDKKGHIIAGNKTVEAAIAAGYKNVIVVETNGSDVVAVKRTDLDLEKDAKAKSLAIADNRISEVNLEWDDDVLASLAEETDLSAWFNETELRGLLGDEPSAQVPEAQIEIADELAAKWKTATGQLWLIGKHRLVCGDATNQGVLDVLMGDGPGRAGMCFTDPPWNVAIGQDSNPRHRQRKGLENDRMGQSMFAEFLNATAKVIEELVDGDVYCVMSSSQWPTIDESFRAAQMHWSGTLVWSKDTFVLGRSNYHRRFEPIWYGWPKRSKSSYCGGRDQDDVWEIPRPKVSKEHPTMKPVDLVLRAIRNSSAQGSLVFEPFNGSGTTLLAAELTGRVARCVEIDPRFVAVCLERATQMGLKAELAGNGGQAKKNITRVA